MLEGLSLRVGTTIDWTRGLFGATTETTFCESESRDGRSGDGLMGFTFGSVRDEVEVEEDVGLDDKPVSEGDFLISPPPLNDARKLSDPHQKWRKAYDKAKNNTTYPLPVPFSTLFKFDKLLLLGLIPHPSLLWGSARSISRLTSWTSSGAGVEVPLVELELLTPDPTASV